MVTVNPLRVLCRGSFYSTSRIGALSRNNIDLISATMISLDSFAGTERTFRIHEKKCIMRKYIPAVNRIIDSLIVVILRVIR
jgi:hypothetical protein